MFSILNQNLGSQDGNSDVKSKQILTYIVEILKEHTPDIVHFQELVHGDLLHSFIPNYTIKCTKSLVSLFKTKIFANINEIDFKTKEFDSNRILHVQLKVKKTNQTILCSNIHSPLRNSTSTGKIHNRKKKFHFHCLGLLNDEISLIKETPDLILLGGDFNVNFTKLGSNGSILNSEKNPLYTMGQYLVTDPTVPSTVNGMAFDAIFCKAHHGSPSSFDFKTIPMENSPFDHYLQISVVKCPISTKEEKCDAILVSGEYRSLITGPRGGMYYFTPTLNKQYLKDASRALRVDRSKIASWSFGESGEDLVHQDLDKDDEKKVYKPKLNMEVFEGIRVSGEWRAIHNGTRGGKFYLTPSQNRVYVSDLSRIKIVTANQLQIKG